ncbi:preprotein translocase subunit SecG [Pseudoxanthomonas suwonensis]|uniref:Protein-export membrane protein SecG n=1 Tax=Pseudoxanthomonas suwonensis TaxID=314722 RepID=A0A0E3UPD4_9GAMM|nr:preprotein translocase subunit SecG [Pseudoxanthomonas suwonensis]AKC87720.1 preprotein translocase subunit SecG [Pseudoxanthomonas suwonensis]
MLMTILNVVYVLVAIAMIALILLQRGAGAAAGSGFGAGASGTVFGARGASNFLSKSTKWLAVVFFGISLFMAWYATHSARPTVQAAPSLMNEQPAPVQGGAPAPGEMPALPAAPAEVPAATPAAPAPAPADSSVPAPQPTEAAPPAQ